MRTPFILAALLLSAGPAAAADRNYSVTGFDRVRVDGPFRVTLTTGRSPFARASGSPAAIDSVSIAVQGRTLVVRANPSSWGGYPGEAQGPVIIEVGTHDLSAAWVNGSGALAIDRVKGLEFDLAIQGSGTAAIGEARVDVLKIGLSGAASATVAGEAPKMTAIVRGTSMLNASGLRVKDATIGAEGPSKVSATVGNSAKVDARGVAVVDVAGGPACTVNAQGSALVTGCARTEAGTGGRR